MEGLLYEVPNRRRIPTAYHIATVLNQIACTPR